MSERDDRHKRLRQCCNADGMHVFTCSERAEEVSKVLQKIKTAISSYKEQAVNLQRKLNILGLLQERGGFCTIDDILTVCEITDYNAALMWVKHLKRNLLLGKHVLPICVLNPPKKTPPSLRRNLTVVALNTFQSHEETHKKAIAFQSRLCRQYKISTKEDFSLKPDVEKMKETIGLIGCEKTKKIVKNLLMDSGFSEAYLHRKLNFRYSALRNAKVQVSNAKGIFKDVWRDARKLTMRLRKARIASRKTAFSALGRAHSDVAHRPRKNVDPNLIEGIVQMASLESDSGVMAHEKRHYDVMYASSVDVGAERNRKLTLQDVTDRYNEKHAKLDDNHEDVSAKTLSRRCLPPHKSHNAGKDHTGEAAIKFGKVPCKGSGPPPLNMQYARAFAKLSQFVPFRFSSNYSWFRRYSTIISSDLKYPVFLGTKNSFNKDNVWMLYNRDECAGEEVIQALPSHDYHDIRAVVVPSTNLLLNKVVSVDDLGEKLVSWKGSKLSVVLYPKSEYSTSAINHVNERWQLRLHGDEETKAHLSLPNTSIISISLAYLLKELIQYLEDIEQEEDIREFVAPINDAPVENLSLSECFRIQSGQLIHLPLKPLRLIPVVISRPSEIIYRVIDLLRARNLADLHISNKVQTGGFLIISLIEAFTSLEELRELTLQITESCSVLVSCALQKLLDELVLTKHNITNFKYHENGSVNIVQLLQNLADVMDDEADGATSLFFRKCNACVLMLEIAEELEKSESDLQVCLQDPSQKELLLYGKEAFSLFSELLKVKENDVSVSLENEPRTLHARYTDGGPDQKQQNLQTKIASAIEFRMEASSHSCVLRRSENCSFDNEAERGNAVLSKKCSTGSTISATKFCSAEECFQYLAEVGMANDEIDQLREVAVHAGRDFVNEMNMWWGVRELGRRWNGQPCFGSTLFATPILSHDKLPLSPSLDDDLRAYSKATKEDKNSNPRFKWIRLNMSWYERHGQIYPSGYYEERVACEDQNCCARRMPNSQIKRLTIETPKVSVDRPGHYADSQEMKKYEESNEHVQRAIDITNSSFACDSPIDSTTFWQKDFFTPSKHVSEFFSIQDLEGKNDVKFQDFIRVFPTEISSIIQALRKSRGSAKTVPEKHQWFPDKKTSTEEYFSRSVATLSHCLEEICRCSNSRCFYRIRGVKYDIVCRLYEHIHEHKVSVPPSILYMKIKEVKEKLQEKGMSFSGTDIDLRERLARINNQICVVSREEDSMQSISTAPNVEVIKLSAIVHSVLCM